MMSGLHYPISCPASAEFAADHGSIPPPDCAPLRRVAQTLLLLLVVLPLLLLLLLVLMLMLLLLLLMLLTVAVERMLV